MLLSPLSVSSPKNPRNKSSLPDVIRFLWTSIKDPGMSVAGPSDVPCPSRRTLRGHISSRRQRRDIRRSVTRIAVSFWQMRVLERERLEKVSVTCQMLWLREMRLSRLLRRMSSRGRQMDWRGNMELSMWRRQKVHFRQNTVTVLICRADAVFNGCQTSGETIGVGQNTTINKLWYSCSADNLRLKFETGSFCY